MSARKHFLFDDGTNRHPRIASTSSDTKPMALPTENSPAIDYSRLSVGNWFSFLGKQFRGEYFFKDPENLGTSAHDASR